MNVASPTAAGLPFAAPGPVAESAEKSVPVVSATSWSRTENWAFALALAALLTAGIFLRVFPSSSFPVVGMDESLYRRYLMQLDNYGPTAYPDIVEAYLIKQRQEPVVKLPPTRVSFLLSAWGWHRLFGGDPWSAVRAVSALFSVLTLLVASGFAYRLGGRGLALGALALMSFAPLQIYLAQRALIDGFFAFWSTLTLWALWECLQRPAGSRARAGWLAVYGVALAAMVLTKENAAFVFAALLVLLGLNRWLRFGRADAPLWAVTFGAPALAAAALVILCGGVDRMVEVFQLVVGKSYTLNYAVRTGDGPWFRYALDLLCLSPVVTLLAIGGGLRVRLTEKGMLYALGFFLLTYAMMCRLRFGMNIRYGMIWDLPLRLLALGQLTALAEVFKRWRYLALAVGVTLVATSDLIQYYCLFVEHPVYDPVPEAVLQALDILKR